MRVVYLIINTESDESLIKSTHHPLAVCFLLLILLKFSELAYLTA